MELTYIMIKPDAVQRNMIGMIIERIEAKGLKIRAMKMLRLSKDLAEQHYAEHVGKPFFNGLVEFITSGPVVAMVVEGKNAVGAVRKMMGATNPMEAGVGTIRGDHGIDVGRNLIHGSDSVDSARREIALYFKEEELCEYARIDEAWVYEK
ncbi:MAG: nucleoside-diphosphate kinase [Bacillota bacterium]